MVVGSLVGGEVVEGHCEEGVERGPFKVEQGLCGPLAGYVASTQSSNNLTSGHVNSENRNRRMCTKRPTRVEGGEMSSWRPRTSASSRGSRHRKRRLRPSDSGAVAELRLQAEEPVVPCAGFET